MFGRADEKRRTPAHCTRLQLETGVAGRLRAHGLAVGGSYGPLAGKIFRIGHLGWVTDKDITDTIETLRQALPRTGFPVPEAARA